MLICKENNKEEGSSGTESSLVHEKDKEVSIEDNEPHESYSKNKKRLILFIIAGACFLSPISTTMFLPAVSSIAKQFHTTDIVINASNACYCVVMSISPCLTSPFADAYGRRKTFIICSVLFTVSAFIVSESQNLPMFFVFRCIMALFGTAFFAVGGSIVGDIYIPQERGTAMGYILIGSQFGLSLAAVIGGAIVTYSSWRVVFYVLGGVGGFVSIIAFLLLPETSKYILQSKGERKFKFNPFSVVMVTKYENVFLASLVSSSLLYNMYCLLTPIRNVVDPRFGLSTPIYGSLFYLAPGLGYFIGSFIGGKWADYVVKKYIIKRGGVRMPEDRLRSAHFMHGLAIPISTLLYGWSLEKKVGGMALPIICMFINGLSQTICFPSINAYCIDCLPQLGGAPIGNNYFIRFIAAAVASGTVLIQIEHIGVGWTSTIAAFVVWFGSACNLILVYFGQRLRQKHFP